MTWQFDHYMYLGLVVVCSTDSRCEKANVRMFRRTVALAMSLGYIPQFSRKKSVLLEMAKRRIHVYNACKRSLGVGRVSPYQSKCSPGEIVAVFDSLVMHHIATTMSPVYMYLPGLWISGQVQSVHTTSNLRGLQEAN